MNPRSQSRRSVFVRAGLAAAVLWVGGCSVYHRAQRDLPPDPHERLALRVAAARDAAVAGIRALDSGDADGAEEAAWNLDKAALSVGDVLERFDDAPGGAEELRAVLVSAAARLAAASEALEAGATPDAGARAALVESVLEAEAFLARLPARAQPDATRWPD